jgi:endoglucanase
MSHPAARALAGSLLALSLAVAGGAVSGATSSAGSSRAGSAHRAAPLAPAPAEVRVNEVGYRLFDPKVAFVMLARPQPEVRFVVERDGKVVYRGVSADDVGRWNKNYGAVYELGFSRLHTAGAYRVKVLEPAASSPPFRIATASGLYRRLVLDAVRYFTSERDGSDVERSVLDRRPANLTDRHAFVYADPRYDANDNLLGGLKRIGGPVDVSGGWFDAGGGYEKFAYTASYADGLMLVAARDYAGDYPTLRTEALFGLRWLTKLWDPYRKVLYVQVGIGNGSADNRIAGDYNYWFLPQAEDRLGAKPGEADYYVEYRPVFEAAPPGGKISPDLAGRFAADFALGAQLEAHSNRSLALHYLWLARSVYAMAETSGVARVVTTFPHDYYPGTEWRSDMAWGAAEMAAADETLGLGRARLSADLADAGHWLRAYIAKGHPKGGDTFNLYDTGAIAEAELLRAMGASSLSAPIARSAVLADMAAQLKVGREWSDGDPFELGTDLGPADATPHAFGLYITNALYERYKGTSAYTGFAQQQVNFALGANPWGSSFVVGAGTTFPHCMQSEIANLAGSLDGRGEIQLGATTDGPSSAANFIGLGTVDGMRACSAGDFGPFDTATVRYEDNVVAWPSVEPADDYAAASLLAFALGAAGAG